MKRFGSALGVDQGSLVLFTDFADGGVMWTGSGQREVRHIQSFVDGFVEPPVVTIGLSMWDIASQSNSRVDIAAENVTATEFEIVFRTWGDTRVARVRASWLAIGATRGDDVSDVPQASDQER